MSPDMSARRLFADDYSSTGQQEWKTGARGVGEAFWDSDFLGLLRFDSLTSEKLVTPDSHIFDGLFFASTSPQTLVDNLRREGFDEHRCLPLEIRARERTLSESLAAFVRRRDSPYLSHFVFKTIEDEDLRYRVALTLGSTPAEALDEALNQSGNPVQALIRLLQDCLRRCDAADRIDEVLGPLEQSWTRWLELDTKLLVEPWDPGRSFRLADALAAEPLPERELTTPLSRQALDVAKRRVEYGSNYRGDVSRDLAELRQSAWRTDNQALLEVDLVERWYSRGRYRAIAWQHEAACVQAQRPWLEPMTVLEALYREALQPTKSDHVEIPDDVITALGNLPADEFRALTNKYRHDLHKWWYGRDLQALRRIADALAVLPNQ